MTTNVYDRIDRVVATDSRWSMSVRPDVVIYIDDVPFEKIVADDRLVMMFAGRADKIERWKSWFLQRDKGSRNRPVISGKSLSLCMIDLHSADVVFQRNQDIFGPEACFGGSGALPASQCWRTNRCARKAVESAKLADRLSGGEVKFFDVKTRVNNLLSPDDYESLKRLLETRGMVMYFNNPPHVPVKDALNDPDVAAAVNKIASGDLSLAAPSASAENEWSDEDLASLDAVLDKYYPPASA